MTANGSNAALRRTALFAGILMSGGLLLFPRLPLLAVIAIIAIALRPNSLGFRREMLPVAGFVLALLILTGVNGTIDLVQLAIRLGNIIGGLLLLGLYGGLPRDTLMRDLAFFGRWFSVQAIATVAIGVLAPSLFSTINVGEMSYETVAFVFTHHIVIESASPIIRPDGFFWEPGVLQFYLNVYLFAALFALKSWRQSLLAFAAVATTQSTTGLVIATSLLGVAAIQRLRQAQASHLLIAAVAGLTVMAPVAYLTYGNIIEKTVGVSRGSSWAREYDLRTALAIIQEYPLTGIGFNYDRYFEEAERFGYRETQLGDENITERPNSNGVLWLAVTMGIPMMLLMLGAMFNQFFTPLKTVFFGILVLSFLSEALTLTPFALLFVFAGMTALGRRKVAARPMLGATKRPSYART